MAKRNQCRLCAVDGALAAYMVTSYEARNPFAPPSCRGMELTCATVRTHGHL